MNTDIEKLFRLRAATAEDADTCEKLIDEARTFQRAQGFVQWTDSDPNRATIEEDIRSGRAYLLEETSVAGGVPVPAAYSFICFDGDPAYDTINGAWHTNGPYAVIHRVAIGDSARGRGVSAMLFSKIRTLCLAHGIRVLRIDTMDKNKRMQHVLEREGFQYCGTVQLSVGERLAYDLILA